MHQGGTDTYKKKKKKKKVLSDPFNHIGRLRSSRNIYQFPVSDYRKHTKDRNSKFWKMHSHTSILKYLNESL